jgi:hypothetical protein
VRVVVTVISENDKRARISGPSVIRPGDTPQYTIHHPDSDIDITKVKWQIIKAQKKSDIISGLKCISTGKTCQILTSAKKTGSGFFTLQASHRKFVLATKVIEIEEILGHEPFYFRFGNLDYKVVIGAQSPMIFRIMPSWTKEDQDAKHHIVSFNPDRPILAKGYRREELRNIILHKLVSAVCLHQVELGELSVIQALTLSEDYFMAVNEHMFTGDESDETAKE